MSTVKQETHESLMLVETPDKIFVHSSPLSSGDPFIVIDRTTNEIKSSREPNIIPDDRIRTISIGAVIGVIQLIAGPYLIVVKSRVRVGEIGKHVIWQLNQFELIPFPRTVLHLNEKQVSYNQTYVDMLCTVLSTEYYYYSHTYDLSHNLQTLDHNSPQFFEQSLIDRADDKFVWNLHALQPFRGRPDFQKFCIPLIHGFIEINHTEVNSNKFKLILISRRSCKRPGTRLFSRGIDAEGNVSNFVETEQIVEYNGDMSSFVQVRGSVPLYWTQKPNLKYKPPPSLQQVNHVDSFVKHFEDLILRYSNVVCVNLVNQHGSEAVLHEKFAQCVELSGLKRIRYEAFDFHRECGNMQWGRLEILMNRLSQELEEFSYYLRSHGQTQEGVFRTNCVDCLDRTNVVQGMLGRLNLESVLRRLNIMRDSQRIQDNPALEYLFKNVWADNGDICSIEYAGTGALKSDFTRTGKRSVVGMLRDGYNASVRYFKNNFIDGFRQDGMNLLLGNYDTNEDEGLIVVSPLEKNRDWKFYTLPAFLLFSMVMWALLLAVPSEYTPEYLLYILFWGSMVFATASVMVYYGTEFVDNPVLTETHRLTM